MKVLRRMFAGKFIVRGDKRLTLDLGIAAINGEFLYQGYFPLLDVVD